MFPKDITSAVTIYVAYTDVLTGNQTAIKVVLNGCFWNDDSISVFQKTGQQTTNNVTVFIPLDENITGRKYVSPEEWNKLSKTELDKHWTVNPRQLPLMIKGENDFEFKWGTPQEFSQQESRFQQSNPNIRRARDINEQAFGSQDMRHIVLRAG